MRTSTITVVTRAAVSGINRRTTVGASSNHQLRTGPRRVAFAAQATGLIDVHQLEAPGGGDGIGL
jgi:hypothetical protein